MKRLHSLIMWILYAAFVWISLSSVRFAVAQNDAAFQVLKSRFQDHVEQAAEGGLRLSASLERTNSQVEKQRDRIDTIEKVVSSIQNIQQLMLWFSGIAASTVAGQLVISFKNRSSLNRLLRKLDADED